jgi:hypothetical protein
LPDARPLLSLLAVLVVGCNGADPAADDDIADDDSASNDDTDDGHLGIALREDGWLRGDLHLHTIYSDGFDGVATTVALAEYWAHETFVAYHPEFAGNGLDFIAITDHDNVQSQVDPGFVSDRMTLIGGEELWTKGHANRWGIDEHATIDPGGNGVTLDDVVAAVDATHDAGGAFSMNHPMIGHLPYFWDVRTHDAVEVWNMGWALGSPEATADDLAEWEASYGEASPFARRAVQSGGITSSGQALVMFEAMTANGVHVAAVGGSDRHALYLPGMPTTYVQADSDEVEDILDGIRARRTFVSRNPSAAQVLMEVYVDGVAHPAGEAIVIGDPTATVTVVTRVGRADGGELRLIHGTRVAEADLLTAELGQILVQEAVAGVDVTFEHEIEVANGDWLYPVVLEPLVPAGVTDEQAALIREIAQGSAEAGDDPLDVAEALAPVFDVELFSDPSLCDPEDWQPDELQCVVILDEGMGSFHAPDMLDRAINAWVEDGAITDWCMGALASPVRFLVDHTD